MLKRITSIQNIGRFKSCSAGAAQFEKITLIFGRNTYGKSTLGDLLSSIETGVIDYLTIRRTIPDDNLPQKAVLSFQTDGQNETPIHLSLSATNKWQPALPNGLRLQVFDDGFLHKNVFAGRLLTRSTKERFSAFVLGEQGVAKAQNIADKNKLKGDATRERTKLHKAALSNIDDLDGFLQLSPTESSNLITERIESLRRKYDALNKQRTNSARIQARKELAALKWEPDFSASLECVNTALQASLQTHHENARYSLAEHIQKHFTNAKNAESWIQQGVAQSNGECCQFCGQTLSKEALQLLELYRQSFDTSYQEHEQHIQQELATSRALLAKDRVSTLKIEIESNAGALTSYVELEEDSQYLRLKEQLTGLVNELQRVFILWNDRQIPFNSELEGVIAKKLSSPHTALDKLEESALTQLDEEISSLEGQYNACAMQLNALFTKFKVSVQDESIAQQLVIVERDGKAEARKLKRIELSSQCTEYLALGSSITQLGTEIIRLNEELRTEQSGFLDQFFARLNKYFRIFGSSDFQLERGEDTSGHKPIYYLKIKFQNIDVSERNVEQVFSESDRRALALAIFWASIYGLSDIDQQNSIIVLDDPVTSFDNHRMTSVHQEIAALSDRVRQIIMLSHFEHGVSCFLNTYRNNKTIQLLSIVRAGNSSNIQVEDIDHFIMTEHEKARNKIFKFVSGDTNIHNAGELRTFFEHEISLRFAKQICLNSINEQNLSDRINRLKEVGAITSEIAQKAHSWREVLNPSHHIWTGNDLEDQRSTASLFRDFIYHELIPAQGL